MLTVTRKYTFDSAHSIPSFPDGHRCRNVHGHTYRLHVTWAVWPPAVTPFEDVESALLGVVALVDHHTWNEQVPSGLLEDFAPWLWGRLAEALRPFGLDVVALRLCEGERSEVAIDDRGVPGPMTHSPRSCQVPARNRPSQVVALDCRSRDRASGAAGRLEP